MTSMLAILQEHSLSYAGTPKLLVPFRLLRCPHAVSPDYRARFDSFRRYDNRVSDWSGSSTGMVSRRKGFLSFPLRALRQAKANRIKSCRV